MRISDCSSDVCSSYLDEAVMCEVLRVDDRFVDIGEDFEIVRNPRVIAIGGEAVADRPLALLTIDERLDPPVLERALADPLVRPDCHQPGLSTTSSPPPPLSIRPLSVTLTWSGSARPPVVHSPVRPSFTNTCVPPPAPPP